MDADDSRPPADRGRVVAARAKLRERFLARSRATPSSHDPAPLGSGPTNRHGMPKLPPDQTPTAPGKWPVLDLGGTPRVDTARWHLRVDGAVEEAVVLDWPKLMALPQVEDASDFHCVTGWSKLDVTWKGVRLGDVLAQAGPREDACVLMCHAYDGYTVNLPLEEALKDDVLLVHTADGHSLAAEHGGPLRVITPQLWAWKGAKWIRRLELLTQDRLGFWEERGYSNTAHPWRNDRYRV